MDNNNLNYFYYLEIGFFYLNYLNYNYLNLNKYLTYNFFYGNILLFFLWIWVFGKEFSTLMLPIIGFPLSPKTLLSNFTFAEFNLCPSVIIVLIKINKRLKFQIKLSSKVDLANGNWINWKLRKWRGERGNRLKRMDPPWWY